MLGLTIGLAEDQQGVWYLLGAALAWAVSLYRCGKSWDAGS